MLVQEYEGAQGLILRRGGDTLLDSQVGEELTDSFFTESGRVLFVMEEDVLSDPLEVRFFRAQAVVPCPQGMTYLIEKLGRFRRLVRRSELGPAG